MAVTKNIVTDYGCPTNGSSDVSTAFLDARDDLFGTNDQVILTVPPGTYNWQANGDRFPFDYAAQELIIHAYGATFTDDAGDGTPSFGSAVGVPSGIVSAVHTTARIESATRGSPAVTLVSLGDASLFSAGRIILIASNTLQGYPANTSDPPNLFNMEYREIVSIVGKVITLDGVLDHDHLSTLPYYDVLSSGHPDQGGPATIYLMPANWNTSIVFRGPTIDINGGNQAFAKARYVEFVDVVQSGDGTLIPTSNEVFTLSGSRTSFPNTLEVDKMIDTIRVRNGATVAQLFFQSPAPNELFVDNATITILNGTPRRTFVRNGSSIGTLKLGALGFGRSDFYDQVGGTIGSITFQPPQYDPADYSISGGLITNAHTFGPIPWEIPGTNLIIQVDRDNDFMTTISTVTELAGDTKIQTGLAGGWPGSATKVGPHPCPSLRLQSVTGCADAVDWSQAGAYDKPYGTYSKRSFTGLTGDASAAVQIWGELITLKVNVTSAAAGTLKILGQFDNYPVRKISDGTATTYAPTVDLSVAGVHTITPPEAYWFTGLVTPFCTSTTAVFTVEIETDQGIDNDRSFVCTFS